MRVMTVSGSASWSLTFSVFRPVNPPKIPPGNANPDSAHLNLQTLSCLRDNLQIVPLQVACHLPMSADHTLKPLSRHWPDSIGMTIPITESTPCGDVRSTCSVSILWQRSQHDGNCGEQLRHKNG